MADEHKNPTYLFANPVRLGFTNIIKAKAYKQNGKETGEPRFDATFILDTDSADLKSIKELCIAELKAMYPGKKIVTRRLTQEEFDDGGTVEVRVPWQDGSKAADKAKAATPPKDQEFFRGKITLKAASKYAPALSGNENGKIATYANPETRASLDKLFYSGAWVAPYVELHTYKAREEKPGGVSLYLTAVHFVKHDTKLMGGGKVNAAKVFKSYAGGVSEVNPTDDLDDEIPF